jgi:hypothetical protein
MHLSGALKTAVMDSVLIIIIALDANRYLLTRYSIRRLGIDLARRR